LTVPLPITHTVVALGGTSPLPADDLRRVVIALEATPGVDVVDVTGSPITLRFNVDAPDVEAAQQRGDDLLDGALKKLRLPTGAFAATTAVAYLGHYAEELGLEPPPGVKP
jgi:hypothetical protein